MHLVSILTTLTVICRAKWNVENSSHVQQEIHLSKLKVMDTVAALRQYLVRHSSSCSDKRLSSALTCCKYWMYFIEAIHSICLLFLFFLLFLIRLHFSLVLSFDYLFSSFSRLRSFHLSLSFSFLLSVYVCQSITLSPSLILSFYVSFSLHLYLFACLSVSLSSSLLNICMSALCLR